LTGTDGGSAVNVVDIAFLDSCRRAS
jgi:hypothetical protein